MNIIFLMSLILASILTHEIGHLLIACLLKIKVDEISIGFGSVIYETQWKGTRICIRAVLFGGYVLYPDDNPKSTLPKYHTSRISNRKTWEKFLTILAGPIANFICAFFLFFLAVGISGSIPSGKYDVFLKQKPNNNLIKVATFDSLEKPAVINELSKKFDGYVSKEIIDRKFEQIKIKNQNTDIKLDYNGTIPFRATIVLPEAEYENPITLKCASLSRQFFS